MNPTTSRSAKTTKTNVCAYGTSVLKGSLDAAVSPTVSVLDATQPARTFVIAVVYDGTTPISGCVLDTHVTREVIGAYREAWVSAFARIEAVTAAEPLPAAKPRKRVSLRELAAGHDEPTKQKIQSARQNMLETLRDEMSAGRLSPLTYYRTRAGLTQVALAEKSGFHQSKISVLELNPSQMTARAARQLATALNIDFRDLLV